MKALLKRDRIAAMVQFSLFLTLFVCGINAQSKTTEPADTPTATASPAPRNVKPDEVSITGTIKGRVVTNDGRPFPNANVIAQAASGPPSAKAGRTDAEGTFTFDDLPAGLYIVLSTAPGYVDETMISGDPNALPRHLIGEHLKITMVKGGVITGVVTDAKGQPVVGVPVQASLPYGASSLSSFMGGTTDETDDRGVYRIFGLPPGQYIVAAGGGGPFGNFASSGFELDVLTYYPSATRDTAVPVTVRSGDEATGIDIKYRGTEGHAISGVVVGAVETGPVGGAVFIIISNAGTSSIQGMTLSSTVEQRRVFSFTGVADGEYDLFAGFQAGPTENSLVASKRVVVRHGDVTGVELKLAQLASIAGTIALEPLKDEPKCDKRGSHVIEVLINAPRDDAKKPGGPLMASLFGGVGTSLTTKGEFVIKNVEPGRYRFAFQLPTEAWYLRSITAPATVTQPPGDLAQGVVTMKGSERVAGLGIVVGQDAAALRGKIDEAAGDAVPAGLRVHLVPAERDAAGNVLRYYEAPVNSDGTFALKHLAPGRYFVISRIKPETDTAPRDLAWDASARTKLRTLAETANVVVELKPCQRMMDYALKLQSTP